MKDKSKVIISIASADGLKAVIKKYDLPEKEARIVYQDAFADTFNLLLEAMTDEQAEKLADHWRKEG